MSLTPSLHNHFGTSHAFFPSVLPPYPNPKPKISLLGSRKPSFPRSKREDSVEEFQQVCSSEISQKQELVVLRPWDVPWDWKVTACVMMPYLMSTIWIGAMASKLGGSVEPYRDKVLFQLHNTDEIAIRMFIDQLLKSVAKLSILYMFVGPHQPFPDDVFSFRWERPFNLLNGWILWASGGLGVACFVTLLIKAAFSTSTDGQMPNEAESLVQMLPLIGSSNVSTGLLLGMMAILAPVCEETLYRGFLLTSLTKWFSVPVSVVLSSAIFALGHQSPGKFIEIFIFGTVLGLIYAQTRNLLAPITMHALWNTGVILVLTYLHLQGHEIQKYVL